MGVIRRRRVSKRWRWFKLKSLGRKHPVNRTYMDEYQYAIIIMDITALGGRASASELLMRSPGRYDKRYLHATLRRMARMGRLRRERGSSRRASPYFTISGDYERRAA